MTDETRQERLTRYATENRKAAKTFRDQARRTKENAASLINIAKSYETAADEYEKMAGKEDINYE